MSTALQQLFLVVRRAPFMVFCLTAFLLLSIANYFLWKNYQSINFQHEEVQRNGEKMFSALSNHNRISRDLNEVESSLKQINDNLIAEPDLAENLGYFYQMETLSRVRLTQLNQLSSQPAEDSSFKAIPFSLRVTGTYSQLINFVHELESGPRVLRIKNFDFSRGEAKGNTLALGLTVELLGTP